MNKRVLLFEAMDVINALLCCEYRTGAYRDALTDATTLLRRYKNTGGTLTIEYTDPDSGVSDSVRDR